MNKNRRDQTQFSPEKRLKKKENGFSVICIFAIFYHTKKSNKEIIYSFNNMQASGLHITQYYNIYKTVMIMTIIIQTIKCNYIEELVHHLRRCLMRKTLIKVKTTYKGAHSLNCKIS